MKTLKQLLIILALWLFLPIAALSQTNKPGKVVINEYMPWPSSACGTTGEFIELLNFGPGTVNIGCYILTDGDFSITIPANTILAPGEHYVLAAQNTLAQPCGNFDSAVTVDLNWNTCGCTSGAIPTSGNGLMTDGATASEQLVLMDASANVVDAVVRSAAESSSSITSSSAGGCTPRTFDLDTKSFNYETIGTTAGRGNSFARLTDGDCGWVRDSRQSANATNTSPGDVSDISYEIDIIDPDNCGFMYGSIEIHVKHSDYTSVFPMNYTYSYDSDNDGDFDFSDFYAYGVDNSPPSISIVGLLTGRYRVTVSSVGGCYLHTFEFTILSCSSVLPVKLEYFNLVEKGRSPRFEWKISDPDDLASMVLQKSDDGKYFTDQDVIPPSSVSGPQVYRIKATGKPAEFYRLRLKTTANRAIYSSVLSNHLSSQAGAAWPMPARGKLFVSLSSDLQETVQYQLVSSSGVPVLSGNWQLRQGEQVKEIDLAALPPGFYQLVVRRKNKTESFKVIRQ